MNLVLGLGHLLEGLMENIVFKPEFVTFNCQHCAVEYKSKNCLSDGRYCFVDLNNQGKNYKVNHNSRDLLIENLR